MGLHVAGHDVGDPMPFWQAYAQGFPHTIRCYDLAPRGDPHALTSAEAWRSKIINSRLTRHQCEAMAERAKSTSLWGTVEADADLTAADPSARDGLFTSAAQFYWHFFRPERIPGVAVAKVHKVLHHKRPALYPILDSKLKKLYRPFAVTWCTYLGHLEVTIKDSPPYWAAFRDDLVRGYDCLDRCRARLARDDDETVRLMADLTGLRLLDIVAWMVANGAAG
jgi:Family of unknown function (DUF6308)